MSAVPFATSGECDTMTIPTFLPIYDSDSALQVRFQKTAYCGYDQFRRTGTRIHVPLAALAQVGGPAASGNHGYRFLRGRARALAHITQGTSPVCSAQLLERGHQHVEHGLVPHVGAPERLDHLDRFLTRRDDALLREPLRVRQMVSDRGEELPVEWARCTTDA